MTVLEIDYDFDDYKVIADPSQMINYRKVNEIIKNSLVGGNTLKMYVLDKDNKTKITCHYNIEMYKSLE